MKLKAARLILFLCLLITYASCSRQGSMEEQKKQGESNSMGELASELDDKIWQIYQDQNGNYWFGTNGRGVFKYDGKQLRRYTTKDGLIDNTIRGIQEDNLGNLFIETPDGISKYDGKIFTTLVPIRTAFNDWKSEPNDLWFKCNNEAYRYDGTSLFKLELPRQDIMKAFGRNVQGLSFPGMNSSPYAVYGISKDKAGNIWFGTIVAGVFRYDGTSFLWIPEKELSTLPDGRVPGVRSILEDKDGNFWLSNFISRYTISEEDEVAKYEKSEGVDMSTGQFDDRLPYFNSGLVAKDRNLWMTTYGGGVWKYDGETLFNFPLKDGNTEALLVCIYEDKEGGLWVGTDNTGIYKFNGKSFERFEPMNNKKIHSNAK